MNLRQAAEMALDWFEGCQVNGIDDTHEAVVAAAEALRQALAEPEQEPVAWMYVNKDGECEQIEYGEPFDDPSVTPLYTAPPKREWVWLTDEEIITHFQTNVDTGSLLSFADGVRYAESTLKEKNCG